MSINMNALHVLEGVLDLMSVPAWIIDPAGHMLLNHHAKTIERNIRNIHKAGQHTIDGKAYVVKSKEINHNTGCILFELWDLKEPAVRLKESTYQLERRLEKTKGKV
jgi:hypothetical protein